MQPPYSTNIPSTPFPRNVFLTLCSLPQDLTVTKDEIVYYKEKAEEWKNTAQSLEDSLNLSEQERQGE